jgi:hypothetical protein
MPVDKLREAAVVAEQRGFTEKAEILGSVKKFSHF